MEGPQHEALISLSVFGTATAVFLGGILTALVHGDRLAEKENNALADRYIESIKTRGTLQKRELPTEGSTL